MRQLRNGPATRRDHGFTLIEVLIAVVLVGTLSAVAVVGISTLTGRSSTAACTTSADAARLADTVYFTRHLAHPGSMSAMQADGVLTFPDGVTLDSTGTIATGSGWRLVMTAGNTPTYQCAGTTPTTTAAPATTALPVMTAPPVTIAVPPMTPAPIRDPVVSPPVLVFDDQAFTDPLRKASLTRMIGKLEPPAASTVCGAKATSGTVTVSLTTTLASLSREDDGYVVITQQDKPADTGHTDSKGRTDGWLYERESFTSNVGSSTLDRGTEASLLTYTKWLGTKVDSGWDWHAADFASEWSEGDVFQFTATVSASCTYDTTTVEATQNYIATNPEPGWTEKGNSATSICPGLTGEVVWTLTK